MTNDVLTELLERSTIRIKTSLDDNPCLTHDRVLLNTRK